MFKIIKSPYVLTLSCILLVFGFYFVKNVGIKISKNLTYKESVQTVLKNISFERASLFLYTNDYKQRFLVSSNTNIANPIADIKEGDYFSDLLSRNLLGVCTITKTSNLPTDSDLYTVLAEKDLVSDDYYYMACPVFSKGGKVIGYVATVEYNEIKDISIELQNLKYYTRRIEKSLWDVI